ncbi:MAG TPA: WecB/TagA/CpsF family glycosyltransferase [Spirochaetia bacterium]|nr:WecB/TagA/CpsF family glycosyltransferase [Spirochaetia bacterium]
MADRKKLTGVQRIHVIHVPIDVVAPDSIDRVVDEMTKDEETHQIVLLRLWDLMRARVDREFNRCIRQASLVIPVSRGIVAGARFLKRPLPHRYMPFDFVIRVLGALETRHRSVYVIGGQKKYLQHVEQNLRHTFPGLHFVGRYTGYFESEVERDIITAVKKASPDLLFTGPGVKARDKWYFRHRTQIKPGIALWSTETFDIFAERRKRPSRKSFQAGTDFLPDLFRKPWRLVRGLVYLYYLFLLLIHRIRHI